MVTFVTVTATPGPARKPPLSRPNDAAFERHVEILLDRVRERGLKLTPQRIAILPPTRPEKGAKDATRRRP